MSEAVIIFKRFKCHEIPPTLKIPPPTLNKPVRQWLYPRSQVASRENQNQRGALRTSGTVSVRCPYGVWFGVRYGFRLFQVRKLSPLGKSEVGVFSPPFPLRTRQTNWGPLGGITPARPIETLPFPLRKTPLEHKYQGNTPRGRARVAPGVGPEWGHRFS